MTDELAIQLEELVQRAAAFTDPNAMQGDIGSAMGELWQQAESAGDQTALANIGAAWERVQALAAQSAAQQALLSGASVVAQAAIEQRDGALTELSELVTAIDDIDTENPRIGELVNSLEEDIVQKMWEYENDVFTDGMMDRFPGEYVDKIAFANLIYEEFTLETIDEMIALLQKVRPLVLAEAQAS